jgi:23S rRNA pseudouridine2605 synthase
LREPERDAHFAEIMVSHSQDPSRRRRGGQASADAGAERVARALARAGVASRREAERLIAAGRVALNGQVLESPAVNVGPDDILTLDGNPVAEREPPRLWRYHKPPGLITTHKDPKGRPTVFERLPPGLPRVISIGRLDLNSEGLLLLTNDGALARQLELPSSGVVRRYRARAFGRASQEKLDRLKAGITVEGVAYGSIDAKLERGSGANVWITLALAEGKNREVRKVLEALGLKVNRLIRVAYGPFDLGELQPGEVDEVPARRLRPLIQSGFSGEPEPEPKRSRPPQSPRGDSSPRGGASRPQFKPASKPKPKPQRRVSPPGGSTAEGREGGGGRAAAPAKPAGPKAYKPGWARPKRKPGPPPPKSGASKRRR